MYSRCTTAERDGGARVSTEYFDRKIRLTPTDDTIPCSEGSRVFNTFIPGQVCVKERGGGVPNKITVIIYTIRIRWTASPGPKAKDLNLE